MMRRSACLLSSLFLLAACGGGGGGSGGSSGGDTASTGSGSSAGVVETGVGDCSISQALGSARRDGLRIAGVTWLQVTAQDAAAGTTRLAGGKPVPVRVDVLASGSPLAPATRQLVVHDPVSGACRRIALTGPTRVPASTDVLSLDGAYVATIPAELVQPGMTVAVLLDDAAGRNASEAAQARRVLTPVVSEAVHETVRVIPLRYRGSNGYISSGADVGAALMRTHPLASVKVSQEAAYTPPSLSGGLLGLGGSGEFSMSTMEAVLDEVDDECARLNGAQPDARNAPKCLGVFPDNVTFRPLLGSGKVVGMAYIGGTSMITESLPALDDASVSGPYATRHWMTYRALTIAHEYGHLLNLRHANCGNASDPDRSLYSDGRLGNGAGYDSGRGFYFSSRQAGADGLPQFADLMSYCSKEWPSDRGYRLALAYRAGTAAARVAAAEQGRWLKASWRNGAWQLRLVSFPPSSLAETSLQIQLDSLAGSRSLPLLSAVIADVAGTPSGPYYVNLGGLGDVELTTTVLRIVQDGQVLLRDTGAALLP